MEPVAIALGSNLGDRLMYLERGVSALRAAIPDLTVSNFIETDPVGVVRQPRFLNGAATGHWRGEARALLDLLMGIEQDCGRMRLHAAGARTLDLDLILFGDRVIEEPGLLVPHPRFRERGFVLGPLSQIAPTMIDPVSGLEVGELYERWKETSPCA